MEHLVRNLVPGTTYWVKVRARTEEARGNVSAALEFTAQGDFVAPNPVTNLTGISQGNAFVFSWTAPTKSTDGSDLIDLKHYKVTIGGTDFITESTSFTLDFETNQKLGIGPSATITVIAIDTTGNESDSVSVVVTNPIPDAVTDVYAVGVILSVNVSWTASASEDVIRYEIYEGSTLRWQGLANTANIAENDLASHTYTVYAVDVFEQQSLGVSVSGTPRPVSTADTTAPGLPTNRVLNSSVNSADPSGSTAQVSISFTSATDNDIAGHEVRWKYSGQDWNYVRSTTSPISFIVQANKSIYVEIRTYDFSYNYTSWVTVTPYPSTTAKDTTAPAVVSGVSLAGGITNVMVIWNASADADVANGNGQYEVEIDTSTSFNTSNKKSIVASGTLASFINLIQNTTYYGRVRAVDKSGNKGSWSATVSDNTGTVGAGLGQDDVKEVHIDKDAVTAPKIKAGQIVTEHVSADKFDGNVIRANSLDAETLKAGSSIIKDLLIKNELTLANADTTLGTPAGSIKSQNWSDTNKTGYRLNNNGLTIYDGTVSASALEIQNSANLMPPEYAAFEGHSLILSRLGTTTGSNYYLSTSNPKYGSQSAYLVPTTSSGQYIDFLFASSTGADFRTPLEAGKTYIYSAWVRSASSTQVAIYNRYINEAGTVGATVSSYNTIGTFWTRISYVWTNTTNIGANMGLRLLGGGSSIYATGLQIEEKMSTLDTPSSWKPPGLTRINGSIIRTGSLISTSYYNSRPAWSLDLEGNMEIANAQVRGQVIVGGSSGNSATSIRSYNYSGSSGWKIDADGNVDFNSGTFRGTVSGSTIIGSSLQTAFSGSRVEVGKNSYDSIRFYKSTGSSYASISFVNNDFSISNLGGYPRIDFGSSSMTLVGNVYLGGQNQGSSVVAQGNFLSYGDITTYNNIYGNKVYIGGSGDVTLERGNGTLIIGSSNISLNGAYVSKNYSVIYPNGYRNHLEVLGGGLVVSDGIRSSLYSGTGITFGNGELQVRSNIQGSAAYGNIKCETIYRNNEGSNSSYRYKENISQLDSGLNGYDSVDVLRNVEPKRFKWSKEYMPKESADVTKRKDQFGFIVEELPDEVLIDEDAYAQNYMLAILWQAARKVDERTQELEQKIKEIENGSTESI